MFFFCSFSEHNRERRALNVFKRKEKFGVTRAIMEGRKKILSN